MISDYRDVPALEDWVPLSEAAAALGVTRQTIHRWAGDGMFDSLHTIGDFYIVRRAEVKEYISARGDARDDEKAMADSK